MHKGTAMSELKKLGQKKNQISSLKCEICDKEFKENNTLKCQEARHKYSRQKGGLSKSWLDFLVFLASKIRYTQSVL